MSSIERFSHSVPPAPCWRCRRRPGGACRGGAASSARRCAARVRRTDKADPGLRKPFVSPSCSSFVPYDNINCVSAGRNLYITAMEPESGKSIVALGLMELLSGRVERLGFFRPIVPRRARRADRAHARALRRRRRRSRAHAGRGERDRPLRRAAQARRRGVQALESSCDFVLCEGTDFTGAAPALDFGLNADLANELGAPVLVVVRGGEPEQTAASVRAALGGLRTKGCTVFGVVVNRVPVELDGRRSRGRARAVGRAGLPHPRDRRARRTRPWPTSRTSSAPASSSAGSLEREVRDVRVGAMSVEHFIEHLVDGALVIVPGDRPTSSSPRSPRRSRRRSRPSPASC